MVKGPNNKIVLLIVLMFILLVPVLTGIFYKSFLDNPSSAIMVALDFPFYLRIGIEFLYYFLLLYFFVGKSSSISRFIKSFGSFIFVRLVTGVASGVAFYYLHLQTEPIDFINILPIAVYEFPIGQLIQAIVTPWLAYPFLASFAPNVVLPETKSSEAQIIEPQNKEIPDEAMISPTMLHNMIQDNTLDTRTSTVNLVDVSKLSEIDDVTSEEAMKETMSMLESFEKEKDINNRKDEDEDKNEIDDFSIDEDILDDFSLIDDSQSNEEQALDESEELVEDSIQFDDLSDDISSIDDYPEIKKDDDFDDTNFNFSDDTITYSVKPPSINRFPSIEQTIQKYELSAVSKTSTATMTIDEEDPMIEEIDEQQIMAGFTQHNNDPFINRIVQENYNVDPDKIAIQYRKEKEEEEVVDSLEALPDLEKKEFLGEQKSPSEETDVVESSDTETQEEILDNDKSIDFEDTEITDEMLDSIDISEELDNLEDTDELPDLDKIEAESTKFNSELEKEQTDNTFDSLSKDDKEELTNKQAFVKLEETSTTDINVKDLDSQKVNEEDNEQDRHELDDDLLEDIEAAMEIAKIAEEDDNISTALFSNVEDLKETGVFKRNEPEVHEDFKDTQIILRNLPDSIDFTNADMPDFIKFTLSDLLICNPLNDSVNLLKSLLKKDATFSIQIAAMQIRKLFETKNPYVTVEQIYAQAPFNAINFSSKNAGKDLSEAKLILPIKKIIDQFTGQLVLTKNHEDITVDTGNLVDLLKMDDKELSDDTTSVFDGSKSAEEKYEMPILDEDLQTDLNPKSIGEYEPRFKEKFEPINDSDLKKADFIEDTGVINTEDTKIAPEIGTTEMNLRTDNILKNRSSKDKQAEDIFSMKVNKDNKEKKAPEVIDDTSELPALSEFESEIAPEIDFDIEEQLKNLYQKGQKIISMQKSESNDKFSDNINKTSKAPEIDLEVEKPPIDISNSPAEITKSVVAPEINDPANIITDKKDTVRNILQKEKPIAPEIDTQINPKDITTKLDKAPEIDLYENMSSKIFPEMEIFKEKEVDPDSTQERVLPKPGKESMIIRLNNGDLDDMDLDELLSHSLEDNTHEFKIVAEDLEDRSPKEALFDDVEKKDEKPEKLKTISFYEDPKKPSIMEQIEEHVKNQEKVEIPGEERFEYMKHSDFTDSRDELVVDYFKEMPKHEDTNEIVKKESELSELEREITQKNIKQNVFSQDDELQEDEDDTVQEYFARVNMGNSKQDLQKESSSSKALDDFDIPGIDDIFSEKENILSDTKKDDKTQDFTDDDITQKDIDELQQENFLDDIYQLIEDTENKDTQKTESGMSFEQIVDIIKTDEYHEFLNSEKPKSKWAELGETVFDNEIFSESQDIDRPDSILRFSMDKHPKNLGNEIQELIKRNQSEPSVDVDHFDIHKDLFMDDHENILNSKEIEKFNVTPSEEDRQKSDLEKIIRPAHEDYSDIFNDNFTSQFTIEKGQKQTTLSQETTDTKPKQDELTSDQQESMQKQSTYNQEIRESEMDISEFTIPSEPPSEELQDTIEESATTSSDVFITDEEHIEDIAENTEQTDEINEFPIDLDINKSDEDTFDFRPEIGQYSEEIIEEPDFEENLDEGFFFETDISLYRKPPSTIDVEKYKKTKKADVSRPESREEIAFDKKELSKTTTPLSEANDEIIPKSEPEFSFDNGIEDSFDESIHIEEPELDTFMFEQISIGSQFDKTNTFVPSNDFTRPHVPETKKSSFDYESKRTSDQFDEKTENIDDINIDEFIHNKIDDYSIIHPSEPLVNENIEPQTNIDEDISDRLLKLLKSSEFFNSFDFQAISKNSILYIIDKKLDKYSHSIEMNSCSGFKSTIDYQNNNIAIMHGLFDSVKTYIFVETTLPAPKLLKIIEKFYSQNLESYSNSSLINKSDIENLRSNKLKLPVYSYSSNGKTLYISHDENISLDNEKKLIYITNIHELLLLVDIVNDSNHSLKDIVIDFDNNYCAVKYDSSIACTFMNNDNQRIGRNLLMAKRLFNEFLNRS